MINSMHSSDELMQQMNFRHGLSSMYGQQLKLDRSLSAGMGSAIWSSARASVKPR